MPRGPQPQTYLRNLAALYRVDAALAARLESLPAQELPALEPAADGHATCQLAGEDGRAIYLHSRRRPLDEAEALLRAQTQSTPPQATGIESGGADGEDSADVTTYFICGMGLGYATRVALAGCDRSLVVVAEPHLGLLKAALTLHDFAGDLERQRLILLTAADKQLVHQKLRPRQAELLLGLLIVTAPALERCAAAFFAKMRAYLADLLAYARIQTVTILRNSRVTCENIFMNLPAYLRAGVDPLRKRAAGYPAILVAAGPSLTRHIGRLRELRERAVIIAVQTVLKPLLAQGITPHFVTSLDFHEISARFLDEIRDAQGCRLVAEPKAAWRAVDAYSGARHILHARLVDDLLGPAAPRRAALRGGSTVAHLSFYLAEYLGCDPIILLGQDLAFSDNLYYSPGMPIEAAWAPELSRFQTIEMKQWERIARGRPIARRVRDVHGREIYTDEQLFTYAEQFQADFARSRARVINAGASGMQLDGAANVAMDAVVAEHLTRPLPSDLLAVGAPAAIDQHAVLAQIEQRQQEIERLRGLCVETAELLERLAGLTDRPRVFNRLIQRVDVLRSAVREFERAFSLVSAVSPLAELRRTAADRALGVALSETAALARRRLRRDRLFVREFIGGCDYLLDLLPRIVARVREGLA